MKNKGILSMVLSIFVSVLLVFSITATCAVCILESAAKSPEWLLGRLSEAETYDSVYSDLMKKYDEISVQTSIPAHVYKRAVSEGWAEAAVKEQIEWSFELMNDVSAELKTDYGMFDEVIAEYFEEYADENHVIRDDMYSQRLAASVENAKSVTASVIDVCRFETIRKTSLWPLAVKYRPYLKKLQIIAFIADAVLILLLVVFRNPLYWTGASCFAAGALLTAPSAYVLSSGMLMKFTIKDYTVFTLITGTLRSVIQTVLTAGTVLLAAGVLLTAVSIVMARVSAKNDAADNKAAEK